jgi:vacuolar-type H+-ATPase subunit I/STV1
MPTVLELYEKLKPKLGEAETRALLEFVETSVQEKAATKDDLDRTEASLRAEIHASVSSLREELHGSVSSLRDELHGSVSSLRDELHETASSLRDEIRRTEAALRKEIQEVKVDLLKWSFAFWVGAVAVLSGIMLALLRAFAGK